MRLVFNLRKSAPINGMLVQLRQNLITLREMFAPEEPTVRGQWARMHTLEEMVLPLIHHGRLLLRVGAPQQEDHVGTILGYPSNKKEYE